MLLKFFDLFVPDYYGQYCNGLENACECIKHDQEHLEKGEQTEYLNLIHISHIKVKIMNLWVEIMFIIIALIIILLTCGLALFLSGKPKRIVHHSICLFFKCKSHSTNYVYMFELMPRGPVNRFGSYRLFQISESLSSDRLKGTDFLPKFVGKYKSMNPKYHLFYNNCISFADELMNYIIKFSRRV